MPRAVIFMVDHAASDSAEIEQRRVEQHMRSLYSILPVIPNRPNRSRCEVVLFLINKQDIWSVKYDSGVMRNLFSEHISKFQAAGMEAIVDEISAKMGANVTRALNKLESYLIASGG